MEMRRELENFGEAKIAQKTQRQVMEKANPKDWQRFTGKTELHQWINAFLCKQFIMRDTLLPIDECESEANEIVKEVERQYNCAPMRRVLVVVYFAVGAFALGCWVGVHW